MKFFGYFRNEKIEGAEPREKTPFPEPAPAMKKALDKDGTLGWFALTAEDHKNLGSTLNPDSKLTHQPGRAQYEVMSDEEIEGTLDGALQTATENNRNLIENGYAQLQKDFFIKSLAFLESVGRLPKKFEGFNISSLPDLKMLEEQYRKNG